MVKRRPRLIFDLDGTLIHTRTANRLAYASIGVIPPEDFNVRPWQEWCSPEDHDRKGEIIAEFLHKHASPTPLFQVFQQTSGIIVTNASDDVLHTLLELYPALKNASHLLRETPAQRVEYMTQWRYGGIYFDDSLDTVMKVRERTKWEAVWVRF